MLSKIDNNVILWVWESTHRMHFDAVNARLASKKGYRRKFWVPAPIWLSKLLITFWNPESLALQWTMVRAIHIRPRFDKLWIRPRKEVMTRRSLNKNIFEHSPYSLWLEKMPIWKLQNPSFLTFYLTLIYLFVSMVTKHI